MRWNIREAVDVYFKAKSVFKLGARTIRAGEPVLIFDTVKTGTYEVASEVSYLTGGRGNSRILSFEGDKTLSFNFEEALLSAEGLAILAGADLIPARNKNLPGAAPDARSVIAHFTEKYSVTTSNRIDTYEGKGVTGFERNIYPDDPTLSLTSTNLKPRGGKDNVWLSRKPYVGQNASIYVMLLDDAGEMAGSPVEINLKTDGETATAEAGRAGSTLYLRKFKSNDKFIAFNTSGMPIKLADVPNPATSSAAAIFDDGVMHYVDSASAAANWNTGWGAIADYERTITATTYDDTPESAEQAADKHFYSYLLAPSGGVAQPKCFKEGANFVYKVNVPSVLYQDIVLVDYYVEYKHDATQVSILPDKFAPFMYVEGSSLVRRASDGMDLPVEFVIPKLKITTAITFTLQSTGDPSTFNFQGDAYPDFSKFDLTRKVLADIQILDADDNYDLAAGDKTSDPTSYRRFQYDEDSDGDYLWKDVALEGHKNLDYSDAGYDPQKGGPASVNELSNGNGEIYHN